MKGFRIAGLAGALFIVGFVDVFAVRLIEFKAFEMGWVVLILSNIVSLGFGFFAKRAFLGKDAK